MSMSSQDAIGSVWLRILAWTVDVVTVSIVVLAATAVLTALAGPTVRIDLSTAQAAERVVVDPFRAVLTGLVGLGLSAAYFAGSWTAAGATPAQRLLRLRLVSTVHGAARPGPPRPGPPRPGKGISARQALLRWLLLLPPFSAVAALTASRPLLSSFVWGSAPVWYLILLATTLRSPTAASLHDRLAKTLVVKPSTGARREGDPRRRREASHVR